MSLHTPTTTPTPTPTTTSSLCHEIFSYQNGNYDGDSEDDFDDANLNISESDSDDEDDNCNIALDDKSVGATRQPLQKIPLVGVQQSQISMAASCSSTASAISIPRSSSAISSRSVSPPIASVHEQTIDFREIKPSDFQKICILGRGDVGTVWLARFKGCTQDKFFALKVLTKQEMIARNKVCHVYVFNTA